MNPKHKSFGESVETILTAAMAPGADLSVLFLSSQESPETVAATLLGRQIRGAEFDEDLHTSA